MPHRSRLRLPHRALAALLLGLLALPHAAAEDRPAGSPTVLAPTRDDQAVAGRVRLKRGVHAVGDANGDGVLQITTDGTVLDLRDAALVGADDDTPADQYRGVGIRVVGARNVTIRGGLVRGYRIGIQAVDAPGLVLEGVDASENYRQRLGSTPRREDARDWLWPHTNDAGEWEQRYGAGLSLTNCAGAHVRRCRVRHGQNGLLLTRCAGVRVLNNDFSFNSGWGVALYRSNRCTLAGNRCDFCVRGYSHGTYARGQDSAGFLVFEQSSDNAFVGNSATHSGDGFFLYAGHETTKKTGTGGCNRNVVYDNDFSFAVANGIEATFSEDNVFVRNRCDGCDHGVWAGYSRRTLLGGNRMRDCLTAGISIEHGQSNRIVHNEIAGGPVGIHLWWDPDPDFVGGVFGKAGDTSSSQNVIVGNDILAHGIAVRLVGDRDTVLRWNVLHGREALLDLGAGTRPGPIEHNLFRGPRSETRPAAALVRGAGADAFALSPTNQRRGRVQAPSGVDLAGLNETLRLARPPTRLPERPDVPDAAPRRRDERRPQGRAQMRIGPWGPLDPSQPALLPVDPGRGTFDLVGEGTWRVLSQKGHVSITTKQGGRYTSTREGTLPGRVTVLASPLNPRGPWTDITPFEVTFEVAGRRLLARGTLVQTAWHVVHFPWTQDPRTHGEAWKALATKARAQWPHPKQNHTMFALDFPWQSGGPGTLEPDRFGTLAWCSLRTPAGRYRIRTVSDDGIRVWVDDKLVIDNWTHHAATEDTAEFTLTEGTHVIRVEHFEIDGWAQLSLKLEALR